MLQNLKIDLALAREFLTLRKELIPKEERLEELKTGIREFGPGEYPVDNLGIVAVSRPSVAKRTGTKLVVDETKIVDVDPAIFTAALAAGLLAYEPVFSRNTAPKVEARVE